MEKYNDFAMPTLENIEQMAKAYKDLEMKNKQDLKSKNEEELKNNHEMILSKNDLQVVFDAVYKLCAVADMLFSKYSKNEQIIKLFDKCKKVKLIVDGLVLDSGVGEMKEFSVAENTALQDICFSCNEIIKIVLENSQKQEIKELGVKVCEIIEITCSY